MTKHRTTPPPTSLNELKRLALRELVAATWELARARYEEIPAAVARATAARRRCEDLDDTIRLVVVTTAEAVQ